MTNPTLPISHGFQGGESSKIRTLRMVSLFSSFLVALSAGSNYGFSSYSPQLQERLHFTSTQINIVGAMGNMGVYLSGPLWGRIVDRKGLRIPLLAGVVLVFIGYGGLAISYRGAFSYDAPIVIVALFSLCTGLGNCAAFTASMNAQAKSWGEDRRGLCTALVLSGFGLSAFFYSLLSHSLFPGQTGDYLLLLAFGSSASYLVGLVLIRILPPEMASSPSNSRSRSNSAALRHTTTGGDGEQEEGRTFVKPNYVRRRTSSEIGGRAWSYTGHEDDDDDVTPSESETDDIGGSGRRGQVAEERRGLLQDANEHSNAGSADEPSGSKKKKEKGSHIDVTGWKLVKSADFLILFLIMTMISGTGLVVINNIGTMTRTLYEYSRRNNNSPLDTLKSTFDYSDTIMSFDLEAFKHGDVQQLQAHQVSAISISNWLGRLLIGLLSDLLVNRTGNPAYRVYLLLVVCALALISQGFAATPDIVTDLKKLLAISSTTGLMYGTLFGLCPVLTFEWFGLNHFSQNWGIISLSPVVAGNIFNLLFGKIYDSHVSKDGPQHLCLEGEECFRTVFQITVIAAIISTIFSILIIYRRAGRPKWISG